MKARAMTFCVAILFLIFGSCGSSLAQSQPPVDLTGKNVLVFHSFEGNAPIFLGTDKGITKTRINPICELQPA